MSINLDIRYPGRANPADTNYPQGSFKNRSAPGVLDGSYLEKDWANDMFAFFQRALVEAGITPNGDVDNATNSQYYEAIQNLFAKQGYVSFPNAVFEASVVDGEAVYWDAANSRFDEAIADGTVKQNAVGFADVTNSKVYAFGDTPLFTGLTPGAKYYLSGTVAGAITAVVPTANVVQVGIAKTATELLTDIDATGSVPLATEAVAGISRNATQAEVNAGSSGNFTVTPSKLRFGFSSSLNSNGYIAFPSWLGGLIIQWGIVTTAGGTITITLPISFPIAFYTALSTFGTAGAPQNPPQTEIVSLSSFSITNMANGSTTKRWIAIGN